MATRVNCLGLTTKGSNCGRKVLPPEQYCFQHKGQQTAGTAAVTAVTPTTLVPVPVVTQATAPVVTPVAVPVVTPVTPKATVPATPITLKTVTLTPVIAPLAAVPTVAHGIPTVAPLAPFAVLIKNPVAPAIPTVPKAKLLETVFEMTKLKDIRATQPRTVTYEDQTVNLDRKDFKTAYIPVLKSIQAETGLENKIGGHVPFFQNGDTWPVNQKGIPLAFIMQFRDPRADKHQLVQLFFDDIEDENLDITEEKAHLRFVDLKTPLNQIQIPEPDNVIKNRGIYADPQQIIEWIVRDEPPTETYIENTLNQIFTARNEPIENHDYGTLYKNIYNQIVVREKEDIPEVEPVKIGGYGDTAQGVNYTEFIHNLYNAEWADSGVLHVKEDGTITGDCS